MEIQKTVNIAQILLFKDDKMSAQFGPALWNAFEEIRLFFETANTEGWLEVPLPQTSSRALMRPTFSAHYLAPALPAELDPSPDPPSIRSEQVQGIWSAAVSTGRRDQYVHQVLGEVVRELLGSEKPLLVVTDQEIVPPTGFRYIIWDVFLNGAVVSLAPLDPDYWGTWDDAHPDRLRAVKWRARAACLSIVGSLLGLSRCKNEHCYLFANVDSVTRLDFMDCLGQEHGVNALANRGFPDRKADPTEVAVSVPVVWHEEQESWR